MSSAPRLAEAQGSLVALVVHRDDDARSHIARVLRDDGYTIVAVDSLRGAHIALAQMDIAVVVLDADHDLFTVAKWLVEASRHEDAPPVVLVSPDVETTWIAERFGLLAVDGASRAWTFTQVVRRSRRESRRPRAPG
jgi:DNA-binding response OmpR family regulator